MGKGQKRKMAYEDLEDHVISWCIEQLSAIRDSVSEVEENPIIIDFDRDILFKDYARRIEALVNLISPLRHEEECLMEWAFNFMDEYFVFNNYKMDNE
jgi:hypothetical protein